METITIKRTRGDVPLMIILACLGLFPGLYIMYDNKPGSTAFILAALFTLLVAGMSVFAFRVIFKHHSLLTLTAEGVSFQSFFHKWEEIRSYELITETDRYYSHETNTYQENDVQSISLTLEDGSSILVSADRFSKKPHEIIGLFDLYKKGR